VSAVVIVPAPVLAPEFASSLVPQPGELATRAVDEAVEEQFLALICADEDLLRAEFDAIIAASWDQPASPQRPGHNRLPAQHPQGRGWISGLAGGLPRPQHEPGAEARSRQRAPPGRSSDRSPRQVRRHQQEVMPQRERPIQVITRRPAPYATHPPAA
jgi:hypothetical protein